MSSSSAAASSTRRTGSPERKPLAVWKSLPAENISSIGSSAPAQSTAKITPRLFSRLFHRPPVATASRVVGESRITGALLRPRSASFGSLPSWRNSLTQAATLSTREDSERQRMQQQGQRSSPEKSFYESFRETFPDLVRENEETARRIEQVCRPTAPQTRGTSTGVIYRDLQR